MTSTVGLVGKGSLIAVLATLFCFAHTSPAAADCGGTPAVATDKADYGPQETVTISGSGFDCGNGLSVLVTAPDGTTLSGDGVGSAGPDAVITDANGAFTLAYHLSGTLPGGGTYEGQLGGYSVSVLDSSGSVLASTFFSDAQGYFSCALTVSGGVKCWGYNYYGSLGNGTFTTSSSGITTPVDVTGLTSGVAQISVGYLHACALLTSGGVKCWGYNVHGELGNGTFSNIFPHGISTPQDVIGLTSGVAQINAGTYGTCAVTTSGGAKCWGSNYSGTVGDGTFTNRATPVDVSGLTSGVVQVSRGYEQSCAVTTSGGAKCWGYNYFGGLGNGTFTTSATPVDVSGLTSGVAQISASGYGACAVTTSGGAKCWGYNAHGQIGNGTFTSYPYGIGTPVDVIGLTSGVARISSGFYHTCALTAAGGAKCWGYNGLGGLGNGTFTDSSTPVNVSGLTSGIAQVSSGFYHTCALTTGGGARCWGYNGHGQLGNGTFTTSATAVDVSGLTSGVDALWDSEMVVSDSIAPTASPSQSPAANGAGWNNTDVSVTWNWTDAGGSGIDAANCTTSSTSSGEGTSITLNASCKDLTGNTGHASYEVMVDKTAPTLSGIVNPNPVLLNGAATVVSGASDGLSGLASESCGALVLSSVGPKTVTCTATDQAGNTASQTVSYQVIYDFTGFQQPVDNVPTMNLMTAGRVVAVKFTLGGNQGLNIMAPGYPTSVSIVCDTGGVLDPVEELIPVTTSNLNYNAATGVYQYAFKTTAAWKNTCRQLRVQLADGTDHLANFRFQ